MTQKQFDALVDLMTALIRIHGSFGPGVPRLNETLAKARTLLVTED